MNTGILLNPYFIILNISFFLVLAIFIYTLKIKNKTQLHFIFIFCIITLLIWSLGQMLEVYWRSFTGVTNYAFVYFYFFGLIFLPPLIMFLGIIYHKRTIQLKPKYLWAFVPGVVSYAILVTSKFHDLFMINYSPNVADLKLGSFFWVHNIITYVYIVIGLAFILYTSLKSSGFFSRQSMMILIGIAVPFVINILISYKIVYTMPVYMTPVSFSFTIIIFLFSILRYDFLNVMPIALGNIFDQMTDGVIMLDKTMKIIDYNNTAENVFLHNQTGDTLRNKYLHNILERGLLKDNDLDNFINAVKKTIETNERFGIEKSISVKNKLQHLSIDVSNVIVKSTYYCTVILIKDVTELRNQMEEIQRNKEILMEKERLASLGNLIGGIAHNLKTPIMAISGMAQSIEILGEEYRDSVDDPLVTKDDHVEIATEIMDWAGKIGPYCSYMSDMISAVKGQAVSLSSDSEAIFTLHELVSRINILMKFELKKYHCELRQEINTSLYNEIKGDISILVQVFNNIITNAIQAYGGESGIIDFKISAANGKILFIVSDKGSGIPDSVQEKLFREMVTTKGKEGTGLGLYMAHSTIRGHFDGNLRFKSEVGKGTTFYIDIPIYKEVSNA